MTTCYQDSAVTTNTKNILSRYGEWLTIGQAAKLLGVPPYSLRYSTKITAYRDGDAYGRRYRRTDVMKLLGIPVSDIPASYELERWDMRATTMSSRRIEILEKIAEGLSNKEISSALGIGEQTTKNHIGKILCALGVRARTGAVVKAARLGLLNLNSTPTQSNKTHENSKDSHEDIITLIHSEMAKILLKIHEELTCNK